MVKSSRNPHQQAEGSGSPVDGSNRQEHHDRDHTPSEEEEGSNDEVEDYDTDLDFGTPIRSRIRYTMEQTRILEDVYQKGKRPSSEDKQKLARRFDTSMHRIQIWFQNKRAKEKKTKQGDALVDGETSSSETEREVMSTPTTSSSRHRPAASSSSWRSSSRKSKNQKVKEPERDRDDAYYPVQLHSDSATQQHSQHNFLMHTGPFYQSGKCNITDSEPSDYPQLIPTMPNARRASQGFMFPPNCGKFYYHMPNPTMNPQDMIYRPPPNSAPAPTYLQEPYTPPEEIQVGVDQGKYFVSEHPLESVASMSSSSKLQPQQLQPQQPEEHEQLPEGPSILTHEDSDQRMTSQENQQRKRGNDYVSNRT